MRVGLALADLCLFFAMFALAPPVFSAPLSKGQTGALAATGAAAGALGVGVAIHHGLAGPAENPDADVVMPLLDVHQDVAPFSDGDEPLTVYNKLGAVARMPDLDPEKLQSVQKEIRLWGTAHVEGNGVPLGPWLADHYNTAFKLVERG